MSRRMTDIWGSPVKVIQIVIESITIELNSDDFLNRRVRNAQRLLKALKNALTVLMRILQTRIRMSLVQKAQGAHTALTVPSASSFDEDLSTTAGFPRTSTSPSAGGGASCHQR
jgi:hypothetical protein